MFFFTGLRHTCNDYHDCEDGMHCTMENSTKPAAFGAKVQGQSYKVCLCDEADGWYETGNHCSGAITIFSGFAPILLGLFIGALLAQKQMH